MIQYIFISMMGLAMGSASWYGFSTGETVGGYITAVATVIITILLVIAKKAVDERDRYYSEWRKKHEE